MATMDPFESNFMSDYPMAEQVEDLMDVGLELETQSIKNEDIDIDLDFSEEVQQDEVMTEGDNYSTQYGLQSDDNSGLNKDDDEMADEDQEFQLVDEEIFDAPSGLVDGLHAENGNLAERKDPSNLVTGSVSFPNAATDIKDEELHKQVRAIEDIGKSTVNSGNDHTDFFDDTVSTEFQPTLLGTPLELQLNDDNVHTHSLQDQPHAQVIQTHDANGQSIASPDTTNQTSRAVHVEDDYYTFDDDPAATFNEDLFDEPGAAGEVAVQPKESFSEEIEGVFVEAKNTGNVSEAPDKTEVTGLSAGSPQIAVRGEPENQNSEHDNDNSNHVEGLTESIDDESLHPITLHYLDDEMSLFPPREDEDSNMYFLADQALINESVRSLFDAFRFVLGESINEGEELSLEICTLDLELFEIAEEARTINLAQLLHLYLKLQRNDGSDRPDPLHLRLKRRHPFLARLDALRSLADQGKGLQNHLGTHFDGDGKEKHLESCYHEDQESDEYDGARSGSKSERPPSTQASPRHIAEGMQTLRKPESHLEHDDFDFDFRSPHDAQRATDNEGQNRNTTKSELASDPAIKTECVSVHEAEANLQRSRETREESAETNEAETRQCMPQAGHGDTEFVETSAIDDSKETLEHAPTVDNGALSAEYSGESSTLHGDEEDPAIDFDEDKHPTDTHSIDENSPAELPEEHLVDEEGLEFGVEDGHGDDHPLAQVYDILAQDHSDYSNPAKVAITGPPIQRKIEQIEKVEEINQAPETSLHTPENLLSHEDEIDFSDDDDDVEISHDNVGGAIPQVQSLATPPESLKRLRSPEEDQPGVRDSPRESKKARPD